MFINGKNRQKPIHYGECFLFFVIQGVCSDAFVKQGTTEGMFCTYSTNWNVSKQTLLKGAGVVGYRLLVMNRIKILCKPKMTVGVPPPLQGHEDLHPGGPPPLQHVRQVGPHMIQPSQEVGHDPVRFISTGLKDRNNEEPLLGAHLSLGMQLNIE
jgi:hypothetical protein